MKRALGAACCLAALIAANGAQAAQRYAAPAGAGGEPCVQAAPCSLKNALTKANENDEVIVTSGSYTLAETLFVEAAGLSIHGDPGGPMPTISATLPSYAIQVSGAGSAVSYLDLINTADESAPLFCIGGRVERVRLAAIGTGAFGLIQSQSCVVRDSVILAKGTGAVALLAVGSSGITAVARNVTAIAGGTKSVGIRASNSDAFPSSGAYTLDLKNTIAQGEGLDLLAQSGAFGSGEIVVSHSNFDHAEGEAGGKVERRLPRGGRIADDRRRNQRPARTARPDGKRQGARPGA